MNTAAAAVKPVATAVLMILVSVFDDVFVATAGVAVPFPAAETAAVAADAVLAPLLLWHLLNSFLKIILFAKLHFYYYWNERMHQMSLAHTKLHVYK